MQRMAIYGFWRGLSGLQGHGKGEQMPFLLRLSLN